MAIFSKQKLVELQTLERTRLPRQTVMIVDDEEANRAVMATILRPYYNIIEAGDGCEALALIERRDEQSQIACIVSDQRMPKLTGVELFQQVQFILPMAVRIIVTGYVDVDSIVDSINKAEIYKFIVKPFDANDFLLTVRRGVESYELQRQLSAYHQDLANQVRLRTLELEQSRAQLLQANAVLRAEVAERERAEAALRKSSEQILALYNNASCGYFALDRSGLITQINDTQLMWLGRCREEVLNKVALHELLTPASWSGFLEQYPAIARDGWVHDMRDVELEFIARDEGVVRMLLSAIVVMEDASPVSRFTVFDITQRNLEQQRIRYLASHDALTNLPNRALMLGRVEHAILLAQRHQQRVALLFVDLDRFKQINDTQGHHAGDQLLQQAAQRLVDCVRKSDSVSRFGGDEFVICLAELAQGRDALPVAHKILETLAMPFVVDGQTLQVSGSLGIAVYPDDAREIGDLMRFADEAMYRSKAAGRNLLHFYGTPQAVQVLPLS